MKRYPIALVTSDIHLNDWPNNNPTGGSRLAHQLEFVRSLCFQSSKFELPILVCGDLFHNAKAITNKLLGIISMTFQAFFEDYPKAKFLMISGNHDQSDKNFIDSPSPSFVRSLSRLYPKNIVCMDLKNTHIGKVKVAGIPYITHNIGFNELIQDYSELDIDILMIHTDLHGAKDTNLYEAKTVSNIPKSMDDFFSGFKLVLSGHIHLPQRLGQNIYMVGAPMHQRKTDIGSDLGYWIIYSDYYMEFQKSDTPQFKTYEEGEAIDDYHIWVQIKKNKDSKEGEKKFNTDNLSKIELVKKYIANEKVPKYPQGKSLIKLMEELEDDFI